MPTQISHNGFARYTIVRNTIITDGGCTWCGCNNHNRLFEYGTNADDSNRTHWTGGAFCSISCWRTYYN